MGLFKSLYLGRGGDNGCKLDENPRNKKKRKKAQNLGKCFVHV